MAKKQQQITDDLDALLDVLPLDIRHAVEKANNSENLLEIILDLGRIPTVRFVENEVNLRDTEITRAEIDYVDERTGEFDADDSIQDERDQVARACGIDHVADVCEHIGAGHGRSQVSGVRQGRHLVSEVRTGDDRSGHHGEWYPQCTSYPYERNAHGTSSGP